MSRTQRNAWRFALTLVSVAAIATTGWSLYAVALHYGTPEAIAVGVVAVFDGAAYACLHLSSEASAAGRSAAGARLMTLFMVSVSVALNIQHSRLIGGGFFAALLFATPTVALLAVSELSWAGPRAAARAAMGERPFRLPAFGGWAWLLAPRRAGATVRERAIWHVDNAGQLTTPTADAPKSHSASAVLRKRFAEMDPAEVIAIADDSQPGLSAGELAELVSVYGVHVDVVQVALVRASRGSEITVERDDANDAGRDAELVSGLPRLNKHQAILEAAALMRPDARDKDVAALVQSRHGYTVGTNYVRTALSREAKAREAAEKAVAADEIGKGGGGYE